MTIGNRISMAYVVAIALSVAAVALPQVAAAEAATVPEPAVATPASAGVWQVHKYTFTYMGFTSIYTCDGLSDKLRLLLRMVGAKPGFEVNPSCARGFNEPDKLATAYLKFSSLQPDPSNPSSPAATGTWQQIEFAPNRPFDLGRGDCELIEEFRDRILPLFAVRNIENNVTCVPHQDLGSMYRLKFEVFAPVKPAKGSKAARP
jgi:hypothetical protein